ncbi:MAG: ribose-phosphate diphosphokinase [Oligoflexales bacterium]
MHHPFLVFASPCYQYLQDEICLKGGYEKGIIEFRRFTDGEHYLRIDSNVSGRDVVVIGSTLPGNHFLEFYDLASGLVQYGARSLTLVLPYYSYSTMERATRFGDVVTAKTRARMLSSLPQASLSNKIVMIDLHSEGIPHYFEGTLRPVHIYASEVISEVAKSWAGSEFVLASTDAGRAKWVESLASKLGVEPAFLLKKRLGDEKTKVVAPASPIKDKSVVIYDDMIRSGNSLIEAAKAYSNAGAKTIYALCTHGIFSSNAISRLRDSSLFKKIMTTNTVPGTEKINDKLIEVRSICPMIVEYLHGQEGF